MKGFTKGEEVQEEDEEQDYDGEDVNINVYSMATPQHPVAKQNKK